MNANTNHQKPTLGFIGLGAMGEPMARKLLQADYVLYAFDIIEERLAALISAGAQAAASAGEVAARSQIILTSLPSSGAFVTVAEDSLLTNAQADQIVIDLGTTTPPETRRLARLFAAKGVTLLDVPVSGGPHGVETGQLYMFAGGPEETVKQCYPLLEAMGPDRITYCGSSGSGQVVKGVNQLMMALVNAAHLEAIAFGVKAGVDAATIQQAIGHAGRFRVDFSQIAGQVAQGQGRQVGVKYRELPYFLREAQEQGFRLPLTETLRQFCEEGDLVVVDDNRPAPSFWEELNKLV